jgi:multidrug efflux pump subunit AcrA (membrane-fusion protein)
MEPISRTKPAVRMRGRLRFTVVGVMLAAVVGGAWFWRNHSAATDVGKRIPEAIPIVSAFIARSDVPVRLTANGTVSAQQTVAVRPQLSAMIRSVHIREGQFVQSGERLFTLDARTEDANVSRTEGLLAKSRAELRNAERNLERQRELFEQHFI